MSDHGRAGRDRGTPDVRTATQTLQEYAMRAQERAEALGARIERGDLTTADEEDAFVVAARRLDLEVSTFVAEVTSQPQGPPDRSVVVTLQLVSTAMDITRRTVDRMIDARTPLDSDGPGADEAPDR